MRNLNCLLLAFALVFLNYSFLPVVAGDYELEETIAFEDSEDYYDEELEEDDEDEDLEDHFSERKKKKKKKKNKGKFKFADEDIILELDD